jgi:hypothetical protein
MDMKGLTTQKEIEILTGNKMADHCIFIQREDNTQKWSIKLKVSQPGQEDQMFFLERQKGGIRLFAHLEDSIRMAKTKFGEVDDYKITVEDLNFCLEK